MFVAELRCLSEFCNFVAPLELMIRDHLICGINDNAIQRRLLAEAGLTYTRAVELAQSLDAVELAQSLEMAAQKMKELKGKLEGSGNGQLPPHQDLHRMAGQPPPPPPRSKLTCYHCDNVGHVVARCKFSKDIVCYQCKKRGHIKRACRSQQGQEGSGYRSKCRTVARVQDEDDEERDGHFNLCQVRVNDVRSPPIEVKVGVDDCLIKTKVDTGAYCGR